VYTSADVTGGDGNVFCILSHVMFIQRRMFSVEMCFISCYVYTEENVSREDGDVFYLMLCVYRGECFQLRCVLSHVMCI